MQAGLNFAQWRDKANNLFPPDPSDGQTAPGARGQVFFGLTPEVGRYLRDTNLAAVQSNLEDLIGYPNGSFLWYATRLGLQGEKGESSYHTPELAWSVFLAQSYVLQANQEQLRYWLDRPWGLGDPWYLQKLIATIEAPAAPTQPPAATPTTAPPPTVEPTPDLPFDVYLPAIAGVQKQSLFTWLDCANAQ